MLLNEDVTAVGLWDLMSSWLGIWVPVTTWPKECATALDYCVTKRSSKHLGPWSNDGTLMYVKILEAPAE